MPFQVGHPPMGGRPKGSMRLGDLLQQAPVAEKRKLISKAYEMAIAGNIQAMEFIIRHSGESNFAAESTNSTLALLMLWQQWQLTPEQQARVLERLTPETRAQLAPVFEGEVLSVVSEVIEADSVAGLTIQRVSDGADGAL